MLWFLARTWAESPISHLVRLLFVVHCPKLLNKNNCGGASVEQHHLFSEKLLCYQEHVKPFPQCSENLGPDSYTSLLPSVPKALQIPLLAAVWECEDWQLLQGLRSHPVSSSSCQQLHTASCSTWGCAGITGTLGKQHTVNKGSSSWQTSMFINCIFTSPVCVDLEPFPWYQANIRITKCW